MESALPKVKTDILNSLGKQKVTCLILLNSSGTFDTVSHDLLLNHLQYRFGVQGQELEWICSYLASRSQKVKVGDYESDPVTLKQGVPRGSVLGLILFSLYTSPIGNICRKHNVNYHGYADDTQNYLSFSPNVPDNETTCLTTLHNCIQDIQILMKSNLLKLNDEKTEFMITGTRQQLHKVGKFMIEIGQDTIVNTPPPRNLGFHYDEEFKNATHVNKLCCGLTVTIEKISKVRHNINKETTKTLMQALVLSKLDYCNSPLLGLN